MAAHTYWMLYFPFSQGSSLVSLSEVQLRETVGGANAAAGATLTPSNTLNPTTLPVANILDGNTATFWASNTQPVSIIFQLTAPADIVQIVLGGRYDSNPEQGPYSFILLYSDTFAGPYAVKYLQEISQTSPWLVAQTKTFAPAAETVLVPNVPVPNCNVGQSTVQRGANASTLAFTFVNVSGSGGTIPVDVGPGGGDPQPPAAIGYLWPRGDGTPAAA